MLTLSKSIYLHILERSSNLTADLFHRIKEHYPSFLTSQLANILCHLKERELVRGFYLQQFNKKVEICYLIKSGEAKVLF